MQAEAQRIWVVIAAYNEAPAIGRVVSDLIGCGHRVVVVDDGSTDATGSIAHSAGGIVITPPANIWQRATLQTGIQFALRRRAD